MSQQQRILTRLAAKAFGMEFRAIRRTLTHLDGSFVAFFFHKETNAWALVNDGLGRLPLYHWHTPRAFYLSRDIRLFTHLPLSPVLDRLGMAQQLMLSYPLGERTLLDKVKRLPPCTLIRSRPETSPSIIRLHTHDFGDHTHAANNLKANAKALCSRFEVSCRARSQPAPARVVALSGGLDSRSVALGLQRTEQSFETATFIRPDKSNRHDVEGAEALATRFGFTAHTLSLPPTKGWHLLQLLQSKGGLNPFDVGFMVSFLEEIVQRYGSPTHLFTGDMGVILRDLRPGSIPTDEQAVSAIVQRCWLSPPIVNRLMGLSEDTLLHSIQKRLATYPEAMPIDRFKHFLFERIYKFSFEGEDRNRYYCWSTAPLSGMAFVRYALQCPDEQKAEFRLYRAFLRRLHPRSLDVGYSDFLGIKITPFQLRLYNYLRAAVRAVPPVKRFLQRHLGDFRTYAPGAPVVACMRDQVAHCPAVTDYFDSQALNLLLDQPARHSRHHLDGLFTMLSVIDDIHGSDILTTYTERPLG